MIKRLEEYRYLKKRWVSVVAEISDLKVARKTYEPMTLNSGIGGVRSSGTSSPTENTALNNLYFYEEIDRKIAEKEKEKAEIELTLKVLDNYVESIDDVTIRRMVDNRYRCGLSWREVAESVYYAPSSWYYAQQKVYDYLNSHYI